MDRASGSIKSCSCEGAGLESPFSLPVFRGISAVGRRLLDGIQVAASPAAALAALLEVKNKAEVYFLVRSCRRTLQISNPAPEPFPTGEYLHRAYARGIYPSLWMVEGLGLVLGESRLEYDGAGIGGLLNSGGGLPAKSLLMLHAGIGLAFAKWRLQLLGPDAPFSALCEAVQWFSRACSASSQPGFAGAARESLGLVVRTFHGRMVLDIDRAIAETAPELRSWYWHGVGRAVYFLPSSFLPCSTRQTLQRAERECIDDLSLVNATAGIAWAMAMVNLRDPDILAELVIKPCSADLLRNDAFIQGAAASLVMRQETTPDPAILQPWLEYGNGRESDMHDFWDTLIRRPGQDALTRRGPALRRRQALDELFHYVPPQEGDARHG